MLSVFRDLCTWPKWTKMILGLLWFCLPSFSILAKLPCFLLAFLFCFESTVSVLTEFQNSSVLAQFLCFVFDTCHGKEHIQWSAHPTHPEGRCGRKNSLCRGRDLFSLNSQSISLQKKKKFPKYQYHMELLIWNSPAHRNPEWFKLNLDNVYNLVSFTV